MGPAAAYPICLLKSHVAMPIWRTLAQNSWISLMARPITSTCQTNRTSHDISKKQANMGQAEEAEGKCKRGADLHQRT